MVENPVDNTLRQISFCGNLPFFLLPIGRQHIFLFLHTNLTHYSHKVNVYIWRLYVIENKGVTRF